MPSQIQIQATGGPEAMTFANVDLPAPGPGQALVVHRAIGINYIDTYHRSGLYPLELPSSLGTEASGVVEAVGPNVDDIRPGMRVAYAGGKPGSYAEARLIAADRLVPLPDWLDDDTAAAMMLKGMTVEYLIRRTYAVKKGQTVLWHAAAGGVGLIACQWLRHLGVQVIGTVGTAEKADLALHHGATHCIVYSTEDFVPRVRELTGGRGVPVVYDSVGKATFLRSLDCLQKRGLCVSFGNASGKPDPFDVTLLSAKGSLYVTRPVLFAYNETREELLASANALFDVVKSGAVKIRIGQKWPLAEAAEAHRALESRQTTGSCLLVP